jgi:hypothetical protein
MKRTFDRIAETFIFSVFTILNLTATCWSGPPGPPDGLPRATPLGGIEITIATAVAIAGYGYWKSRK